MMLEQIRASRAFADVGEVKKLGPAFGGEYKSLAMKLAAMIRSAGLCQALHFLKAKAGKASKDKPNAHAMFLDHLGGQLQRIDPAIKANVEKKLSMGDALCDRVRGTKELAQYLRLTREALAVAHWYSRLVRAEFVDEPQAGVKS